MATGPTTVETMQAAAGTRVAANGTSAALRALREHWPEYAIEAWALGTFMVSAAVFATLLEYPGSPVHQAIVDADLRRVLGGVAMGLTAIALIYSPWGQRSGAHMNPAVTLTFLRLGKVRGWDALFYALAQFAGGTLGMIAAFGVLGDALARPPVSFALTQPGAAGPWVALAAEFAISCLMMLVILGVSSNARLAKYAGLCAGLLVATFISLEAPLSGMSMNPARSFASALPGGDWNAYWIYLLAPVAGMQCGALLHAGLPGRRQVHCAKLMHGERQRCIHCGYVPPAHQGEST